MPVYKKVNKDFFKKWTREMAYVLGFFAADGCMIESKRGGYYLEFNSTDRMLLKEIRKVMKSTHMLAERSVKNEKHKRQYRLQIGSKVLFNDLLSLGFVPNKTKRLNIPNLPRDLFADFLRGYFDGDGNVWVGQVHKERITKTTVISVGFTSGCKIFLVNLKFILFGFGLKGGSLVCKKRGFCLKYSVKDSMNLYDIMYRQTVGNLFLLRKRQVFEKYIKSRDAAVA